MRRGGEGGLLCCLLKFFFFLAFHRHHVPECTGVLLVLKGMLRGRVKVEVYITSMANDSRGMLVGILHSLYIYT